MRAILFDFGGTLDFPRHWLDRFVAHYQAAGIPIERDEFDAAFSAATGKAYRCSTQMRDYGLSQLVGFLVELQFEELGGNSAAAPPGSRMQWRPQWNSAELRQQIRDSFVAESRAGYAISRPLLRSLARRLKVGVVSNFYGNLDRVLIEADLASGIDVVADSARFGFHKPDPKIFAAALAQLGVAPHDTVMVGDSLHKDCAPARAMGMTTIWLRHRDFGGDHTMSARWADFTIESLEGLKDFKWLAG